mmetsp:Transcript_18114/g.26600  ORF Transcript_18114/g.26600 Transcript_18114/m.26600 type:complete len:145 (+) Transcript_18114:51-485(+)
MSHSRFAKPLWHLIDARGQLVGRLASQVTHILKGKHKPTFSPNYDCGDYVVIINARHVKFSGEKETSKLYHWHTGYPGGIKSTNPANLREKHPEEILRKAILGMLAKNRLRKRIAHKLRIFPGKDHAHIEQLPPGTPSVISEPL